MSHRPLLLLALTYLLISATAWAQPLIRQIPFAMPATDTTMLGRILGVDSFRPIGASDYLRAAEGDFIDQREQKVKFFGVSLVGSACYPDSIQAMATAARLRSFGINAVRLTGWDNPGNDAASFLRPGQNSDTLDLNQVRRLHWLVHQLRRNGIYIFLTLHSAWRPRAGDRVFRSDSIPTAGRAIGYFDPLFVARQKQILRAILNQPNPFTGQPLARDPAIAWMTMTEENSLFNAWRNNTINFRPGGATISWYHSRMLDTLYTRFLTRKYGSQAALRSAWELPALSSANVASDPGFEEMFNVSWQIAVNGESGARALFNHTNCDKQEGQVAAHIRIGRGANAGAISFFNLIAQPLERFRYYSLRFFAKAPSATRPITVQVTNGLNQRIQIGTNWQEYIFNFRVLETSASGRITFQLGETGGDVLIDNVQLAMQSEPGLAAGELLADHSVRRASYIDSVTPQRMRDNAEFYTELTENLYTDLYRFLKDTIRVSAMLTGGTQYVNLNDLYAQRAMDFSCEFEAWDFRRTVNANEWWIANDAMLRSTTGGIIPNFARAILAGKPNLFGSFSAPFPSAHLNEMTSVVPAYAAYQDADGVFLNAYADTRDATAFSSRAVPRNVHNVVRNLPALMSTIPAAAIGFRHGALLPARRSIPLRQTRDALLLPQFLQAGTFWLQSNADNRIVLFRRVYVDSLDATLQSVRPQTQVSELLQNPVDTRALLSDTEEILWNADESYLTINTPRWKLASGDLRRKVVLLGDDVRIERVDTGWIGTFSWINADTHAVTSSPRSLLTLATRSVNRGAQWSGDSSIWQNWGDTSQVVEPMTIRINYASQEDSAFVYPLDSIGRRTGQLIVPTKLSNGRFNLEIDQSRYPSLWFEVEHRSGLTSVVGGEDASSAGLDGPFPNPSSTSVAFNVRLPADDQSAQVSVFNCLGELVAVVWQGQTSGQEFRLNLPIGQYTSGTYFCRLRTNTASHTVKFTVGH